MSLIDADELIENIKRSTICAYCHNWLLNGEIQCKKCEKENTYMKGIQRTIQHIHTVDTMPVVHGEWLSVDADRRGFTDEFACSVCDGSFTLGYYYKNCDYNFCPRCGAKMDGDSNG